MTRDVDTLIIIVRKSEDILFIIQFISLSTPNGKNITILPILKTLFFIIEIE